MNPETVGLLINAGIAGVFAVFALTLIKSQSDLWVKFFEQERAQRMHMWERVNETQRLLAESIVELRRDTQENTKASHEVTGVLKEWLIRNEDRPGKNDK